MLLTSCSGDGPSAAEQRLEQVRQGFLSAQSVHLRGSFTDEGRTVALDLVLVGDRGGKGVVTVDGTAFRLIRIGEILWFQAPPAFYASQPSLPVDLLADAWLEGPAATGQFAELAALTRRSQVAERILTTGADLVEEPGTGGTVRLRSASGVLVASTDPVRPLQVTGRDGDALRFDEYDREVALTRPSPIVTSRELAAATQERAPAGTSGTSR